MSSTPISTRTERFMEKDVTFVEKVAFERALDFHNVSSTSTIAFVCTGCGTIGESPTEQSRNLSTANFDFSECVCDGSGGRVLTLTSFPIVRVTESVV